MPRMPKPPAPLAPSLALLPPVVRAFVQQQRLPAEAVRGGGRVVLTIDQRFRVHLVPASHHRVALQCELLALPERPDRPMQDLLMRLAKAAAGLMQRHASGLAIDERRRALVLQQQLPADAGVHALQQALAEFTNTLVFWHGVCRVRPAPALPMGVRP